MLTEFKKISELEPIDKIFFYSFLIIPILILSGNLLINFILYFISFTFITAKLLNKINFKLNNKIFYLLTFFFLSLVINLIFSDNIQLSFPRVIKSFFIIFFVLAFKYLIDKLRTDNLNFIYKIWTFLFSIITIDLLFELFFQKNIFGFQSSMPGRLVGFAGSESNIGYLFSGFALIFLSFLNKKFPNKFLLHFFLIILLVSVSFLIGERSNFFKTFFIIICYFFIAYKVNFKKKILPIVLIFLISFTFSNTIKNALIEWKVSEENAQYYGYNSRYFWQLQKLFEEDGIKNFLADSQYGAHYSTAIRIAEKNPFFGVGIKNFRVESFKREYVIDADHKWKASAGNTHPHQIHFEFLSETGLFGYFCFLIFIISSIILSIKNYLINKNPYQLSGILFVISNLIPLLPSGSFFSTYTSIIFWLNYALMVGYINLEKN